MSMLRLACLALLATLAACAANRPAATGTPAYSGTVHSVYEVTKQGRDVLPGRWLGKYADALAPKLRRSGETHQYVLRTPTGQVLAQSDEEFAVGECLDVIPRSDSVRGPAFRLGEAQLVRSENCPALAESSVGASR